MSRLAGLDDDALGCGSWPSCDRGYPTAHVAAASVMSGCGGCHLGRVSAAAAVGLRAHDGPGMQLSVGCGHFRALASEMYGHFCAPAWNELRSRRPQLGRVMAGGEVRVHGEQGAPPRRPPGPRRQRKPRQRPSWIFRRDGLFPDHPRASNPRVLPRQRHSGWLGRAHASTRPNGGTATPAACDPPRACAQAQAK